MFYRPATGRFKDTYVFWNEGRFHLFSMYADDVERPDYRNVWMAESADGVHFTDVGPVIRAPFEVWAMSVAKIGDRFVLNHGSFTRPGVQNVLRFWDSGDLVHWTYHPERDLSPDPLRRHPESRLDCMDVIPVEENGRVRYYGYATGPGGFLESDDGVRWRDTGRTTVEWDPFPPPPTPADEGTLEIGGCQEMGGKYYLVGGWFNYMGFTGYGTYTLVGDSPTGPFRPDAAAYRLCGNSNRWVSLWARFCRTPGEVLVAGYMYSGFSYESGETWLPPLKKAVLDGGRLRLRYWQGNDAVKGREVPIVPTASRQEHPRGAGCASFTADAHGIRIEAGPERNSLARTDPPMTVVLLEAALDARRGVVLEGTISADCRDPRLVSPSVGFYLEETAGAGTAVLFEGHGVTRIGQLTLGEAPVFACEDEVTPVCASAAGIVPRVPHTFRLLIRGSMFEVYLDDRLVQTFNTTHAPGAPGAVVRRIGFIARNGSGAFGALRAWEMTLRHDGGDS